MINVQIVGSCLRHWILSVKLIRFTKNREKQYHSWRFQRSSFVTANKWIASHWRLWIYNGILVPVRTSFGLRRRGGKMYQRKVDVDMLNSVKSVSHTTAFSISTSTLRWYIDCESSRVVKALLSLAAPYRHQSLARYGGLSKRAAIHMSAFTRDGATSPRFAIRRPAN